MEVKLDGEGPWQLPDGSGDFQIVLTPGHTEAHCCAVYKPDKVRARAACMNRRWAHSAFIAQWACHASQALFSGDHLASDVVAEWYAADDPDGGHLGITRNFNWWVLRPTVVPPSESHQGSAQSDAEFPAWTGGAWMSR